MDSTGELTLAQIADLLGVTVPTVRKWHGGQVQPGSAASSAARPRQPLREVAAARGIPVRIADQPADQRYPRAVVTAFAQAVGYMDADGELVPEAQGKGRGKWLPAEPTIDPGEGRRLRFYMTHAAELVGQTVATVRTRVSKGKFAQPDGVDELSRPYWFAKTLQAQIKKDRGEPDGYRDGKPFWRPGPDNPWKPRGGTPAPAGPDA
ncbi:hypothetical protein [Kitasatospora sp. NPDC088783]|uniref:hypothetical protein n=1 Tax=Kitasatospora sp. NPDC088783 TaxID=3364077 RepID=UPI0038210A94